MRLIDGHVHGCIVSLWLYTYVPLLPVVVMNSLRELSMKTSILSDPSQVPHQLAQYAKQDMQRERSHNLPRLT